MNKVILDSLLDEYNIYKQKKAITKSKTEKATIDFHLEKIEDLIKKLDDK